MGCSVLSNLQAQHAIMKAGANVPVRSVVCSVTFHHHYNSFSTNNFQYQGNTKCLFSTHMHTPYRHWCTHTLHCIIKSLISVPMLYLEIALVKQKFSLSALGCILSSLPLLTKWKRHLRGQSQSTEHFTPPSTPSNRNSFFSINKNHLTG